MSIRPLFASLLLLITASAGEYAFAQNAPAASDSWSRPAPASSVAAQPSYGNGSGLRESAGSSGSHFKFKEKRDARPQTNAALEATGKAAVMGGNEIGRDGRPTVSCAQTLMDPACR
jgi:hypothetical protein